MRKVKKKNSKRPSRSNYLLFGTDYKVPKKCAENFISEAGKRIGTGSKGNVYDIGKDHKYVVKILPFKVNIETYDCRSKVPKTWRDCEQNTEEEFQKEVEISTIMGELGIGPKVYSSFICTNVFSPWLDGFLKGNTISAGFIVMQKLDMTLKEYKKKFKKDYTLNRLKIAQMLSKKIIKMYWEENYFNRDIHGGNVMLKFDKRGNISDVFVVDFGETKYLEGEDDRKKRFFTGIINDLFRN
jgi:serine/threonine protein kinase